MFKKNKEKKITDKKRKMLSSNKYTIIFVLLLAIFGAISLVGMYFTARYLKTYGETNNNTDLANIITIVLTMIAFVLVYVISLSIMNSKYEANPKERFGVQNRLIIVDAVITSIVFIIAFLNIDSFKIFASSLFTIRYFPNSYTFFLVPLLLVPNLLMIFYVDKYMAFRKLEDIDEYEGAVNMNSSIIENPLAEEKKPENVWTDEKPIEADIQGAAETVAAAEAQKPKEELSPISIKQNATYEQTQNPTEFNNLMQQNNMPLANGAQAFSGFESAEQTNAAAPISPVVMASTIETNNENKSYYTQQDPVAATYINNPVQQPSQVVQNQPMQQPVQQFNMPQATQPNPAMPQEQQNHFIQPPVELANTSAYQPYTAPNETTVSVKTTVSNSNENYTPPAGTNPHQFDSNYQGNVFINNNKIHDHSSSFLPNNNMAEQTTSEPATMQAPPATDKTCPVCNMRLDINAKTCFMCGHNFN